MQDNALTVTLEVVAVLEQLQIPYLVGGSMASALHGFSRTTLDSDLVADIRPEHVPILVQQLGDRYYIADASIYDAIRHRSSFNLIHLAKCSRLIFSCPKRASLTGIRCASAANMWLPPTRNAPPMSPAPKTPFSPS